MLARIFKAIVDFFTGIFLGRSVELPEDAPSPMRRGKSTQSTKKRSAPPPAPPATPAVLPTAAALVAATDSTLPFVRLRSLDLARNPGEDDAKMFARRSAAPASLPTVRPPHRDNALSQNVATFKISAWTTSDSSSGVVIRTACNLDATLSGTFQQATRLGSSEVVSDDTDAPSPQGGDSDIVIGLRPGQKFVVGRSGDVMPRVVDPASMHNRIITIEEQGGRWVVDVPATTGIEGIYPLEAGSSQDVVVQGWLFIEVTRIS